MIVVNWGLYFHDGFLENGVIASCYTVMLLNSCHFPDSVFSISTVIYGPFVLSNCDIIYFNEQK